MTTETKGLTPTQRRAYERLFARGRAHLSAGANDHDGFARRTLDALVDKGLAEWADHTAGVWPGVVKPGENAARKRAALAAADKAARERADKIAALAADPVALATFVVDLDASINARITHTLTMRGIR